MNEWAALSACGVGAQLVPCVIISTKKNVLYILLRTEGKKTFLYVISCVFGATQTHEISMKSPGCPPFSTSAFSRVV